MEKRFIPNPQRALWLSLIIPGAGQIYNRKLWKIPIVYGGFLGCLYALTWNNQMYGDYSQAYLDIMDDDPNTKSYENMLPLNYSIAGREDQYKENIQEQKELLPQVPGHEYIRHDSRISAVGSRRIRGRGTLRLSTFPKIWVCESNRPSLILADGDGRLR